MVIPAPSWTPTAHEYHSQLDVWSASRIKTFRESPAAAFEGFKSAETPSEALVIGSAINAYVLGLADKIHKLDVSSRSAPTYARALKTWGDERLVLTKSEAEKARGSASAILEPRTKSAEFAKSLLTRPGHAEWAWQWEEPVGEWEPVDCPSDSAAVDDAGATLWSCQSRSGWEYRPIGEAGDDTWSLLPSSTDRPWEQRRVVACQAMLDKVCEVYNGERWQPAYVELKSTRDPSPKGFTTQSWNLWYHCQAAWGRRALRNALGDPQADIAVYFVAVRNAPMHEVWAPKMSEDLLDRGDEQLDRDLASLVRCLDDETGAAWCHPWEALEDDVLPTLDAPRWA